MWTGGRKKTSEVRPSPLTTQLPSLRSHPVCSRFPVGTRPDPEVPDLGEQDTVPRPVITGPDDVVDHRDPDIASSLEMSIVHPD